MLPPTSPSAILLTLHRGRSHPTSKQRQLPNTIKQPCLSVSHTKHTRLAVVLENGPETLKSQNQT